MVLALALALAVGAADRETAAPTGDSLLAAWEAAQRGDAATVRLERLGERRYRFETTRFPFSGELAVTGLSIDQGFELEGEGVLMGVVEVELVGADVAELTRRQPYSYARWQASHMLYWDEEAARWLTAREWQASLARRSTASCGGVLDLAGRNLFWLLLLVLLVATLIPLSRRANRQMKSAMAAQEKALAEQARSLQLIERSIELAEDSNRTLHAILDELRGGRGPAT